MVRSGGVGLGRQVLVRFFSVWFVPVWCGLAGELWLGDARLGMARCGEVWQAS